MFYMFAILLILVFQDMLFIEQLGKNLDAESKLTDIVLLCCVDMLRAASYVPPHFRDIPLHTFASEIILDLKVITYLDGIPKNETPDFFSNLRPACSELGTNIPFSSRWTMLMCRCMRTL